MIEDILRKVPEESPGCGGGIVSLDLSDVVVRLKVQASNHEKFVLPILILVRWFVPPECSFFPFAEAIDDEAAQQLQGTLLSYHVNWDIS